MPSRRLPNIPPLSSPEEVAEAAAAIVQGEADRGSTEGVAYKPMALPSAAEVAAELAAFTAARNSADQAEFNTNREQEEASALYSEAQALATEIYDEVDFFHRRDPSPASRRAKNRRWGVGVRLRTYRPGGCDRTDDGRRARG